MKAKVILSFILMMVFCLGSQAQQREHIVKRGETFETIARKYSVSLQRLKEANATISECYAGRKITIPSLQETNKRNESVSADTMLLVSGDEAILSKGIVTIYHVGNALWKERKFDEAIIYLKEAASRGESRAYYPLADCYAQMDENEYNGKKAVYWYQRVTESDILKSDESYWLSCRGLAYSYLNGIGADKDLPKARRFGMEYKRYAARENMVDVNSLLNRIATEEQSIRKAKAEKKSMSLNAKPEYAKTVAATDDSRKKQIVDNNNSARESLRQSNPLGGIPAVGETKYWEKYGYCSVSCHKLSDGTVVYDYFPSPIQKNMTKLLYVGLSEGWHLFKKVILNYAMMPFPPFTVNYSFRDIPGELKISSDGNTVVLPEGTVYDKPINKDRVLEIDNIHRRLAAMTNINGSSGDSGGSSIVDQINEEIKEMEMKESQRSMKERDRYEKRAELARGHRVVQNKSTNTTVTPSSWCSICNRFAKPHTHPVGSKVR